MNKKSLNKDEFKKEGKAAYDLLKQSFGINKTILLIEKERDKNKEKRLTIFEAAITLIENL